MLGKEELRNLSWITSSQEWFELETRCNNGKTWVSERAIDEEIKYIQKKYSAKLFAKYYEFVEVFREKNQDFYELKEILFELDSRISMDDEVTKKLLGMLLVPKISSLGTEGDETKNANV